MISDILSIFGGEDNFGMLFNVNYVDEDLVGWSTQNRFLDDAGRVIIRDPWGDGTRYLMNWDDFTKHWQSHAVWWGG